MPTIQFDHDLHACSPSSSISASLRVKHTMEINGASQQPVELQNPSLSLLRAMRLGADLRIELMCLLGGAPVPPARVQTFSFISTISANLREVGAYPRGAVFMKAYAHTKATCGAAGLHHAEIHGESDRILRRRLMVSAYSVCG
jgi:hypothetical protein